MQYVNKKATVICTGCPTPTQVDLKKGRTVKINNETIGVEADLKLSPNFPTCLVIPTAPKPCSPSLSVWTGKKQDVKVKGKSILNFPTNAICAKGGMVTMVFAGQMTSREGATSEDVKEIDCGWQGDSHKHKGIKKYINGKTGNTKREKLKGWDGIRPKFIYLPKPYEDIKILCKRPWGNHTSTIENYATQKHHVIPVQSMEDIEDLAANLEFLGYNINNMNNGIRLPMYYEDIFWHDLPMHFNWTAAHAKYNSRIRTELKEKFDRKWKLFCSEDMEENLLIEVQKYIDDLRNKIIQWNPDYFVVENGGDRNKSFTDAGFVSVPEKNENKKYPLNTN